MLDAAFAQLAASRRVDVPLRQHIEELYATRCGVCRRPVVVDQFIWPRDGDAPGRKVYRCGSCDLSRGGAEERSAPIDAVDLAKLGIERRCPMRRPMTTPPRPARSRRRPRTSPSSRSERRAGHPPVPLPVDPPSSVGERPRFASTVRPDPLPVAAADGVRHSPAVPGAARPLPGARRSRRPRRRAARPVHAAQPVRDPRHRRKIDAELRDTARAAVDAAGARHVPAAGQSPQRLSGAGRVAADHRGSRPPAGEPASARGQRLAGLRARVPASAATWWPVSAIATRPGSRRTSGSSGG